MQCVAAGHYESDKLILIPKWSINFDFSWNTVAKARIAKEAGALVDTTTSTMQGRITIKNNRNMKCDLL